MDEDFFKKILFIFVTTGFGVFFICYATIKLREKHSAAVRTVWYFFFLALVSTIIIGEWAVFNGSIDKGGNFQGATGEFLSHTLKTMLDVNKASLIIIAAVCVIILPQIFSYILSGIFGCAASLRLFNTGVLFLVWGIVKTFAVAAGIIVAVSGLGIGNDWAGFSSWLNLLMYYALCIAVLAVMVFGILLNYYEIERIVGGLIRKWSWLDKLHNKCTKYSAKEEKGDAELIIDFVADNYDVTVRLLRNEKFRATLQVLKDIDLGSTVPCAQNSDTKKKTA